MATPEQQPVEEQTVSGVITGVVTKNVDTWQVAVQPADSQYTKNLWTKDAELVGTMTAMIGQEATFFCRVSHWVRQDGQSVRSLWVNGWTAGAQQQGMTQIGDEVAQAQAALEQAKARQAATAAQPQPGPPSQPQPQGQPQPAPQPQAQAFVAQDVKELRIMREAADKCAVKVLVGMLLSGHLKEEDINPARMHSFMDAFARRRILFYETGESSYQDEVPF